MFKDKFVFSQIVSFLDRNKFNHIVRKYGGDKYVKHFTCWNQLLCLMFGQLSNRASLRDLIVVLEAHRGKLYHLGLGKNVSKTTLAKSNQERDYRIFEEYAYFLVDEAQRKRATDIFKLGGNVYAFDYNDFKSLYHIHLVEAKFVVRAKKNLKFKTFKWKRKLPKNVLSDAIVELTGYYPQKHYPEQFRIVRYWDEEQEREFVFITNAMDISALQVAELYKNRWKIELFFKWLKQHLKIKKFWGTTENAVRIQIYSAICAYCLVAIIQHEMQLTRTTYEVLQILSISLTDKTCLKDLFESNNVQYNKDRSDQNGQLFINF